MVWSLEPELAAIVSHGKRRKERKRKFTHNTHIQLLIGSMMAGDIEATVESIAPSGTVPKFSSLAKIVLEGSSFHQC